MKKLNLKIGNFKELTREQMKKVSGGYNGSTICYHYCEFSSPETEEESIYEDWGSGTSCTECQVQSNYLCTHLVVAHGWENCHYDCACDGYGFF